MSSESYEIGSFGKKRKANFDVTSQEQGNCPTDYHAIIDRLQTELSLSNSQNQELRDALNRAGTTLAEMEQTQKQQTNTICRLTEENLLLKNSWEKSNDTSTNLSQELKEANEEIKELEKREVEDRKYLYSLNLQALCAMSDLKTARDKIKKMKEDHSQICVSFHEQLKNFCKEISILKRSCNAKDVFINQQIQEIEEIRSKMLTERMTIKEALEQSKQGHDQLMELLQQHHPLL